MRVCRANDGDNGCPWGIAADGQRPFFDGPIRCGPLVNLSRFAYTHSLIPSKAYLRLNPLGPCVAWEDGFPVDFSISLSPAPRLSREGYEP